MRNSVYLTRGGGCLQKRFPGNNSHQNTRNYSLIATRSRNDSKAIGKSREIRPNSGYHFRSHDRYGVALEPS